MKQIIIYLAGVAILISTLASCRKTTDGTGTNNNGTGTDGTGTGGSGTTGGNNTATITYKNNTFTTVDITVNNSSKTINSGGAASFSGTPNSNVSGTAATSGKTSAGTLVGLLMSWTLNNNFPSTGNSNIDLNIDGQYFFLRVRNNSPSTSMNKLYVNYGLVDQTVDNISIPNNGTFYNIGYYKAYTNSNVRTENGNLYWFWPALNLPFAQNQSITITGN